MRSGVLVGYALAGLLWSASAALASEEKDYQKIAEEATWEWHADQANAAYSLGRCSQDYQIELVRKKKGFRELIIRFMDGDKEILSFKGSPHSVFAQGGSVLYYADFKPYAAGCSVVAYDLKERKQLWRTDLKGLGPIAHSGYNNYVNLDLTGDAIAIHGNESAGKYLEYLDLKNGKTVGHRVFEKK